MVVYDVTDRESFNAVRRWVAEIRRHTQAEVVRVLVGNKSDLAERREVSTEEGLNLANSFGVGFVETSAKDALNVTDAFLKLTRGILEQTARAGAERAGDSSAELFRARRGDSLFQCCAG